LIETLDQGGELQKVTDVRDIAAMFRDIQRNPEGIPDTKDRKRTEGAGYLRTRAGAGSTLEDG
jgi:hypothetical protein